MGDVNVLEADRSSAAMRRYVRSLSTRELRKLAGRQPRGTSAVTALSGALLVAGAAPVPVAAAPGDTPSGAPSAVTAPTPSLLDAPLPPTDVAPVSATAPEAAPARPTGQPFPAPGQGPEPEGTPPLLDAPLPVTDSPMPGPAPTPVPAAPQVLELTVGSTLIPPPFSPVPLGGEIGVTWGPGMTDFGLTMMGGAYTGGRVTLESRPPREPGWSGEAKASFVPLIGRLEGAVTTDLSEVNAAFKGNLGPFFLGATGEIAPNPQFDGFRGGLQYRLTDSITGLGLVTAVGPRWTSETVDVVQRWNEMWSGLNGQPFVAPGQGPEPEGTPPLLDAPLPPTDVAPDATPLAPAPTPELAPPTGQPFPAPGQGPEPEGTPPLLDAPLPPTGLAPEPADNPAVELAATAPIDNPAVPIDTGSIPAYEPPAPIAPPPLPAYEPDPAFSTLPSYDAAPAFEPTPMSPVSYGVDGMGYDTSSAFDATLGLDGIGTGLDVDSGLGSDTGFDSGFDTGMDSFDSGFDSGFSDSGFSGDSGGGGFSGGGE